MNNYLYFQHNKTPLNIYYTKHYFTERNTNAKGINNERYIDNIGLEDIIFIIKNNIDKMINKNGKYLFSFFTDKTEKEQAHIIVAFEQASIAQPYEYEVVVVTSVISDSSNAKFRNFGINRTFINNIYLKDLTEFSDTTEAHNYIQSIYNRMIKYDLLNEHDIIELSLQNLSNIFFDKYLKIEYYQYVSLRESFEKLYKLGNFSKFTTRLNNINLIKIKDKKQDDSTIIKPKTIGNRKLIIKSKKIKIDFNLINPFDIDMLSDFHLLVENTRIFKDISA
jgi:hypothetical protein